MKLRSFLPAALLCTSALTVGCGDDDKSSESDEHNATPAQAIEHIGNVKTGLDDALAKYKAGDKDAADEIVGDAYLKEFELVEGPLEERDHELNEELEDTIREELRDKIKAGAPASEVETLITQINSDLDKAEAALR